VVLYLISLNGLIWVKSRTTGDWVCLCRLRACRPRLPLSPSRPFNQLLFPDHQVPHRLTPIMEYTNKLSLFLSLLSRRGANT